MNITLLLLLQIPEKQCMKLSYKFDPGARGGAGGYNEIWVPVKRYSEEEATSAILKMVSRHEEKAQKLHQKLQEKYMQPLVVSKQVNAVSNPISMTTVRPGTLQVSQPLIASIGFVFLCII